MTELRKQDSLSLSPAGGSTQSQIKNTTCAYCGVGCGVDVEVTPDPQTQAPLLNEVKGTPDHPANFGRLCVKGSKLLETNDNYGRLLEPQINGKNVDWSTATRHVADKFKEVIEQHGPDSVAFYVSGQLLTEDYYVANKLMKGYIGSANIDTNSRLCMSSAVAAYQRAFGSDTVPCNYEDLEQTELLVLIGSNAAWTHPVLFQRMERAKQVNPDLKVVFVDPRRTASCELGDLHLAIKPGSDVALFNGLLNYLATRDGLDNAYLAANTEGFEETLCAASEWSVERVADYCDMDIDDVKAFYACFLKADKAVSFYSMGVNQSSSGVDKASSIINCHLATGKIGREGCGPFSITGQPNAMGGREVGGLANMLAAHMSLDNPQHRDSVQSFWNSPVMADKPGYKAVELFERIEKGEVKAVWVMATNPVVSMPNRNQIEAALKKCELVVVSDCVTRNDTLAFADVKLPATGWSEKNGTVTNSERRISRQRGILPPSGNARHDWQIICDVAKAMGFEQAFDFSHPYQIFAEHAALSGYDNNGKRDFDISALSQLTRQEYDQLRPVQWPVNDKHPNGCKRMFSDGRFFTQSGKANLIPLTVRAPVQLTSEQYPYVLNSGRVRDQWHTMTRTGKAVSLSRHIDQSYVSIHPADADSMNIVDGDLVELTSKVNKLEGNDDPLIKVVLAVQTDKQQRRGELFAPMHWNLSGSSSASIAPLFSSAKDPISGQPELKHAAVSISKLRFSFHGQFFCTQELSPELLNQKLDYWIKTPINGGYMYRFASEHDKPDLYHWFQLNLPLFGEWMSTESEDNSYFTALRDGKLVLAVFFSNDYSELESAWIEKLFTKDSLDSDEIAALLRARPDEKFRQGRTVCSCFGVGEKVIVKAIQNGCSSVGELGEKLKCGTNCGSCKSELSQLINEHTGDFCEPHQLIAKEAV